MCRTFFSAVLLFLLGLGAGNAQIHEPVLLPQPDKTGGKPLMQCLAERKSTRSFSPEALSPQQLSNLLWAAFGINRPESGHRTAPSAMNWQEMDLYVFLPEAVYTYNAAANQLDPVLTGDHRAHTGTQPFVGSAAVNLVYVADFSRITRGDEQERLTLSAADAGFISQNVYLYCASENLATVVRASIDRDEMSRLLALRPDQHIVLAQSVGLPVK